MDYGSSPIGKIIHLAHAWAHDGQGPGSERAEGRSTRKGMIDHASQSLLHRLLRRSFVDTLSLGEQLSLCAAVV